MSALAAAASSGDVLVWLGAAVSASILVTAVLKIGAWVRDVNSRFARHDRALTRLGTAVADDEQEDQQR